MKTSSNGFLVILLLLSMVAWGGTWTSSKLIANMAEPEVLIFWRFLLTVITFFPVMFFFRESFRINRRSGWQILLGGILLFTYNKFFFWGLQNGLAGAGGVLVTTLNPILTFLFAILIFRRKALGRQVLGLLLGFIGGGIILQVWSINLASLFASGNGFFILACIAWAALTLTSERSKSDQSPIVFSFYVYCAVTVLDTAIAIPYGVLKVMDYGWIFWGNMLYMSIFATTFATTVFFIASGRLGSEKASAFIFTIPFSAVLIAWLVIGEQPRLTTVIGGLISISAVYLINSKAKPHPQAEISSARPS